MRAHEFLVSDLLEEDMGRGFARIDLSLQKGFFPGDTISIFGKRETFAIVQPCYPGDKRLNLIRMDNTIRRNAKTTIGENVVLHKMKSMAAKKVVLNPLGTSLSDAHKVAAHFIGRPLIKGDVLNVMVSHINFNRMQMVDLFKIFKGDIIGSLKFFVEKTEPTGVVKIEEDTKLVFKDKEKIPAYKEFITQSLQPYHDQVYQALVLKEVTKIQKKVKKLQLGVSQGAKKELERQKRKLLAKINRKVKDLSRKRPK